MDLVEFLSKLRECQSIKLCVSSRPWSVFSSAYDQNTDGQLEVQELTRSDIRTYVSDKMNQSSWFGRLRHAKPKGCSRLVDDITDKAQGVFLWVYLVVRSLLRGLNNDDGLKELRQRLREYPQTLDGYFQRMSDRIEKLYRSHSARIMIVALRSEEPLPLCAPRCLEHEMADPDYTLKTRSKNMSLERLPGKVPQKGVEQINSDKPHQDQRSSEDSKFFDEEEEDGDISESPISDDEGMFVTSQRTVSKRYLDARCADLLEIVGDGISFIHRTARDFLEEPRMLQVLRNHAGAEFDPYLSLARLALWRIKSLTEDGAIMGTIFHDMLRREHSVEARNLAAFGELLYDFDAHGDEMFEAHEGPVGCFTDTKMGMLLLDEAYGSYHDSVLSFAVSAVLNRLRDKIRPKEAVLPSAEDEGDEEEDFSVLFGRNPSHEDEEEDLIILPSRNFSHRAVDGFRGRMYMVEYDSVFKPWLRRPSQPP